MTSKTNLFLFLTIATILLVTPLAVDSVFADKDDNEKKGKQPKTLESECGKKLDKKKLNLDGLFCQAIFAIQEQLTSLSLIQTDPNEPVLEIQVDPTSAEPALVVNDGTNPLFTVNNDGSIQIGSNTVIINPDGTVTGPLHLEAGSTVDGQLISTGAHTTDTNADTLCTAGNYLDGDGTCKPIPTSSGGTVTQVNTGSGLTGGPITTSGIISVDNGGITGTHIATSTITSSNINTSFMKFVRLADDTTGNAVGWNPDGSTKLFSITESSIVHTGSKMSVVTISLHDNNFSIFSIPTCSITNVGSGGPFKIGCNNPPTNGAILGYVVITP